jgi:hypothetical protein
MVQILTKLSVTYMLVSFCPLIFVLIAGILGVSSTTGIDSSFLSGFIAASGIFAGFLVTSAISGREALDLHHYVLLLANLGIFFCLLNVIFIKHLFFVGRPDLVDFAIVMVSVNANAFTAVYTAFILIFHEFILRFSQIVEKMLRSGKHPELLEKLREILKDYHPETE